MKSCRGRSTPPLNALSVTRAFAAAAAACCCSSTFDTTNSITFRLNMAFVLRRPFAVGSALKQTSIPSSAFRAFHQAPCKQAPINKFGSKFASSRSTFRNAFQSSFRRNYQQASFNNPVASGNLSQRLLYGAGIFGGTLLAVRLLNSSLQSID